MKFKDKTEDGHPQRTEDRETITLAAFTDRVYHKAPNICHLNGMHDGKVLRLEKSSGFADFVVWNPWIAGAAKIADMDDEEWSSFICVEAVQSSKVIHVKASNEKENYWKASHVLSLRDAIEDVSFRSKL